MDEEVFDADGVVDEPLVEVLEGVSPNPLFAVRVLEGGDDGGEWAGLFGEGIPEVFGGDVPERDRPALKREVIRFGEVVADVGGVTPFEVAAGTTRVGAEVIGEDVGEFPDQAVG